MKVGRGPRRVYQMSVQWGKKKDVTKRKRQRQEVRWSLGKGWFAAGMESVGGEGEVIHAPKCSTMEQSNCF